MQRVGFVQPKMVDWTEFYTSPKTRGAMFIGIKPETKKLPTTSDLGWFLTGFGAMIFLLRYIAKK